jgi:CDGSH-type Zn-finger protein/truncated hemoglobin YjbI
MPGDVRGTGPPAGQGPLAQLIATRGGRAAPEAPFVIEHREALIYMLCQAAELEHGIMCQYLFAAFSLKQAADEGLSEAELAATARWRKQVSTVATQEMLHLALVHNLLSAIGAAPHFARPNLPAPASHYPAGVQLALLPFGEEALQHFMFLERPEGMDLADAAGLAAMGRAQPQLSERDIVPRGQDFATVGHLYRSIEQGFAHLTGKYSESWLFVGPPRAQATQAQFGWPELIPVTDLASAQRAIEEILEQGEGPRGHWENAHFGQFVRILDEYGELRAANPAFEPVRPVVAANVRPPERDPSLPLISNPLTARVTDLFNVAYEILLQIFERFFAHTEESDAQLKTLADATIALMIQVIKPLGDLITTLPVGEDQPGRTAGPSFELFYESDYLMPHRNAAWALLAERLDTAAWLCSELCAGRGERISGQLQPVLAAIRQIATALAAHLPPGVPQSQLAHPRPDAAQIGALLTRVSADLTAAAGAAPAPQAGQLRELAGRLDPATAAAGSPAGDASTPAAVWAAATEATRLAAQLAETTGAAQHAAPGGCPPQLAEAAAGLQDLALRLAPAGEHGRRLAELWQLQAGLPTGIQVAPNGPYLVTNVAAVIDHLGIESRPAPRLALCRCGGSAAKPACDRSCTRNGFTDAKDPNRVRDQRDTYQGQQVTIFDNRGICQHSGYCTDRLASVFRSGTEPFVAPSGGRPDEIIHAVRDCPSGALSYALGGREAREAVDREGTRPPVVEITRDGPYRVTGGIPLSGTGGEAVARAQGSSAEHYALCRCGHSQNKPFCSGMHWYVQFRDPAPVPGPEPSLFGWAGGLGPLTRLARLLYEKHVPADPLLAPVFADMPPGQPQQLAAWLAEAFGGPAAGGQGSEPPIGAAPDGQPLAEESRARWVSLVARAADEAGLPADPAFRSAFTACIEWASRAAGQPAGGGAAAPGPVPRWDWGPAGPPPVPADEAAGGAGGEPAALPGPDEQVSFEAHIRPLFRERDRQSMSFAFDLWSHEDVRAHASGILQRLQDGSMPCDGGWPAGQIEVFRRWSETGAQP